MTPDKGVPPATSGRSAREAAAASLRRRRDASRRLEPLACGCRDPLGCLCNTRRRNATPDVIAWSKPHLGQAAIYGIHSFDVVVATSAIGSRPARQTIKTASGKPVKALIVPIEQVDDIEAYCSIRRWRLVHRGGSR